MRISQITVPAQVSLKGDPTYIQLYEAFNASNVYSIPLTDESGMFTGIVYRSDFFRQESEDFQLEDVLVHTHIYEHFHILETIREFLKVEYTEIPVLDSEDFLIGLCKLEDVQYHFNRTIGLTEGNSMLVIETTMQNFSLVDIGRIVESNQARVLNFYMSSHPESNQIELTVVLNVSDIADIIATFQRFDYFVTYSTAAQEQEDFIKDRYDSLMHFLDI